MMRMKMISMVTAETVSIVETGSALSNDYSAEEEKNILHEVMS